MRMGRATPFSDTKQCITHCMDCYRMCIETAMTHCLRAGGAHVEPSHFRLMINCADLCRATADFLLSESEFEARICALCADVCEACAASCREVGEMEDCVLACEICSGSCAAMVSRSRTVQTEPVLTHPKARQPL
jgi:hypothetical protein